MLALRALCILSGLLFGVQNCCCDVTRSQYYRQEGKRLPLFFDQIRDVTEITCCTKCHMNSSCNSVSYNPGSKICQLSSVNMTDVGSNSEDSDEWATSIKVTCFAPPTTAFASVQPSIQYAHEEQRVNYSCNEGYLSTSGVDKMIATCQANGTWTPLLFECKDISLESQAFWMQLGRRMTRQLIWTQTACKCNEKFGHCMEKDSYHGWQFWIQGHRDPPNTGTWTFNDGSEIEKFFLSGWFHPHQLFNCMFIVTFKFDSWLNSYCDRLCGYICELVPQND